MIPGKSLLDKKAIFLIVLLSAAVAAGIYFRLKTYKLSQELQSQKVDLEKSSTDKVVVNNEYAKIQQEYAKLQNDYDRLKRDSDSLSADRERLQVQVRGLLADRALARKLESSLDKANQDMELLTKDKQQVLEENLTLKEQVKDLRIIQRQLIAEKEQLSGQLARERDKSVLKKIEQENSSLKQEGAGLKEENARLNNSLKQSESELVGLRQSKSTLREEVKKLNEKLGGLNQDYAEAVKKNKLLENKVSEAPKKFTELARQNKVLIKRTADMHYNMGVFYTKQKEYARAAAEFQKTIELRPDDAYAHFNLGYIYAEYLANRTRALEHFRRYLRFAKEGDKDVDWVKKYIITWQAWNGKQSLH